MNSGRHDKTYDSTGSGRASDAGDGTYRGTGGSAGDRTLGAARGNGRGVASAGAREDAGGGVGAGSRRARALVRRTALVAVTAAAALTLAACAGGDGDGGSGQEGPRGSASATASASASESASTGARASTAGRDGLAAHNAQDVAFAQGMIPHHRQALEMARLVDERSASAGVKDLATRIETAQDPEITTMTGWLRAWGETVPEASEPMPGMEHSGHSGGSAVPGMMDSGDMAELAKTSGTAFDRMFLAMMVEHHRGAVAMAVTEKRDGRYGPAKALADAVVTAQNAEIAEMTGLLGTH